MAQRDPRSEEAFRGPTHSFPNPGDERERARAESLKRSPLASGAQPTAGDFLGLDLEVKSRVSGAYTQTNPVSLPAPMSEPHFTAPAHATHRHAAAPRNAPQPAPAAQCGRPAQPSHTREPSYAAQPSHTARPSYTAQPSHTTQPGHTAQPSHTAQQVPLAELDHPAQSSPIASPSHAHPSLFTLMQPGPSEVQTGMEVKSSNSWLLGLDDAHAGRAGHEPVVADPTRSRARQQRPTPLDASFAEPPRVVQRTLPWIVGGLIVSAACSFVFVVAHTLLAPKEPDAQVTEAPLAPLAPAVRPDVELADPRPTRSSAARATGKTSVAGTKKPANGSRAARADANRPDAGAANVVSGDARTGNVGALRSELDNPGAGATGAAVDQRAGARGRTEDAPGLIETPPPEFAPALTPPEPSAAPGESRARPAAGAGALAPQARNDSATGANAAPARPPSNDPGAMPELATNAAADAVAWWPGALRTTPIATSEFGPGAGELAASSERRERVARWLMQTSRSAAPLADTQALYTPPDSGGAQLAGLASSLSSSLSGSLSGSLSSPRAEAIPTPNDARVVGSKSVSQAPSASATHTDPRTGAEDALITNTTPAGAPSGLWEGATVPVDQIASRVRILTPKVGYVRAALENGEVQEGRLYAVGLGQVWIDSDLGRVALARTRIERLEQIATPVADPVQDRGAEKPVEIPVAGENSPRVRVRTPGGLFYGRVLTREGNVLTLLTDEGARITIESAEIELAPARKTVVKREPPPVPKKVVPAPAPVPEPEYDPDNPHGLH